MVEGLFCVEGPMCAKIPRQKRAKNSPVRMNKDVSDKSRDRDDVSGVLGSQVTHPVMVMSGY